MEIDMDPRFSAFFLEKYRLLTQRGARPFYEDRIHTEKVYRPSKLRRLIRHIVASMIAYSKMRKGKDRILIHPKTTTKQSYSDS